MKALTKNKLTSHGCDADAAICRLTVFLSKNAVYRTCRGCAGKERTCLPGTATIFAYFYNLDNISCTIHNIHTTIIQYISMLRVYWSHACEMSKLNTYFKYVHKYKYLHSQTPHVTTQEGRS